MIGRSAAASASIAAACSSNSSAKPIEPFPAHDAGLFVRNRGDVRGREGSLAATAALERMERGQAAAGANLTRREQSFSRIGTVVKAHLAIPVAEIGARLVQMGEQSLNAAGDLDELAEQRGGHTFTRFYGRPRSWMSGFAPRGAVVKSIRQMASDGRIEGTLLPESLIQHASHSRCSHPGAARLIPMLGPIWA